jgi:hypothetical protein
MMNLTELPSVPPGRLAPFTDQLRLAVATYLAWIKGSPPRLLSSPSTVTLAHGPCARPPSEGTGQ